GDEILYAIQEERLTGEKNYWGFPAAAIAECLKRADAQISDIEQVVFGANQLVARYHSREEVVKSYERQDEFMGKVRQRFLVPYVLKLNKKFGQKDVLEQLGELGLDTDKVTFFDHHQSHAA